MSWVKMAFSFPSPSSISYLWNGGSLLGVCLFVQISSGVFLSFFFSPEMSQAFQSVINLSEDIPNGWLIRSIHANGASFFFMMIYVHVARGIYFGSFANRRTWITGVTMLFTLMAVAFLGYVLPWGQMSFWGATVITNLLSSLPWGESLVSWVWGGFSVGSPTLSRFFSLHFFLPLALGGLSLLHVFFLHEKGSSNPLGVTVDSDKIHFHPSFTVKDLMGLVTVGGVFIILAVWLPYLFMDSDNFIEANPMSTPAHIQPEWYFLFAYAILRSIPSKVGGVVCMMASIMILLLPLAGGGSCVSSPTKQVAFYLFISSFLFLSWVGGTPAEGVMILAGRAASLVYFGSFLLMSIV